jgi:hypothetical protein
MMKEQKMSYRASKIGIEFGTTVEIRKLDKLGRKTRYTEEVEVTVTGKGTPGRPPPPCSNHDSPAFSDAGDPTECDDLTVELGGIDVTDRLVDGEMDKLLDRACEEIEEEVSAIEEDDDGDFKYDQMRDREFERDDPRDDCCDDY